MLILTRKLNESIMIGDQIEISIVDIRGDQVKLGIQAPKNIKVYRQEVYRAIQKENIEAVKSKPELIFSLDNLLDKSTGAQSTKMSKPKNGKTGDKQKK
ncbi:MAG: carbon storage regulator CsrA [Spirochaetes bacterium]|nr:carbon storage regulator CsrA [Spirochaetota bacterium]